MMKTVLVTGGAGFIGSHLCELLLKRGHKVICADNLGSGNRRNVEHLLTNDNFSFMQHDIVNPLHVDGPLDQIYHLASRASPVDYQQYPVETALANSMGTHNMIKLAMEKNATLLFSSTSEAYGEPKVHPQVESYWGNVNPVGVRSCYDESKRFGEALLMAYKRQYNVDIKIVRIFNTYGPRMRLDDGRVIPNFITQVLKNKPITIYGDGMQTRSLCYVSDLVDGLYMMMNSGHVGPKNLGNPEEITMLDLAKKIKNIAASSSEFVFHPLPEDDPTKRQPDISMAMQMLGFQPRVSMDEGLQKTVEWFKEEMKRRGDL